MANLIGQVLFEQFRIDAFIASGGMGSIYRVWDLKRNVPLAMKILNADLAEDAHVFNLFEREARALKKLAHPNIVSFYGLFQTPEFVFLLEQYIDGSSLKDILSQNRGQSLDFTLALTYIKAIAAALGYAHSNGVVHCDVKPGNVLVDRGGNIFLTDFGIARHADSTTTTLATLGTAAYMTPEQIRGEPVGPATDVYALGVMLFEMVTGQRPFNGTEVKGDDSGVTANERIRAAHLHVPAPDAHSINPAIPASLAAVIQKAMSKPREARYQSASELLTAICFALGVNIEAIPNRANVPSGLYDQPTPGESAKRPKPTPALWVGLLLIILFGGIFAVSRENPKTTPLPNQISRPFVVSTEIPSLPEPTEPPTVVPAPTAPPQIIEHTLAPEPTFTPKPTQFSCPGAPHEVRFKVNQTIRVCTQKDPLRLRAKPDGDIVSRLSPGSYITITGGPRCVKSVIWWRVQTESGTVGWIMDGWDPTDTNFVCDVP
jgi:serine/threonine protein kinase